MRDAKERLERLRIDADECELIGRLATNDAKRSAFMELSTEYRRLASKLETLVASGHLPGDLGI